MLVHMRYEPDPQDTNGDLHVRVVCGARCEVAGVASYEPYVVLYVEPMRAGACGPVAVAGTVCVSFCTDAERKARGRWSSRCPVPPNASAVTDNALPGSSGSPVWGRERGGDVTLRVEGPVAGGARLALYVEVGSALLPAAMRERTSSGNRCGMVRMAAPTSSARVAWRWRP